MFTPQRKSPCAGQVSPAARISTLAKGKAVAFIDGPSAPPPPPPLLGLMNEGVSEDWKRFKEVGLLDEGAMERRDRNALVDRVSRLEKELFDYQYNMGLLLIEKEELGSKCEELSRGVAEVQEILKREQAAHIIALSEAEMREENLRKALNMEKKCVLDLERALRNTREEHVQIKVTSEATVADANARTASIEEKRQEVERKLHSADLKLAEANRKISELDRKLQEVEARENILRRERLTFDTEQEAHQAALRKQKEDLIEWERKLQVREEKLCEGRRFLNEREEKLQEKERIYKQKEVDLEQLEKKIDLANQTYKKTEDNINSRLTDLISKEEKAEAVRSNLEMREKQLCALEERLTARERVEIQKLLDDHRAMLDTKMQEFELEMEQNRKSLEEEMRSKMQEVEQKEAEINHREVKLGKQEEALEKKSERVKEKEKDADAKAKALKDKEKHVKAADKKMEVEREQLITEKEELEFLKQEIEMLRSDIKKKEHNLSEEYEKLRITEEERTEHLRLQCNLKQELEKWRNENELLVKETEDLRQDRIKFEKEWEALDEKRATLDNELEGIMEEKSSFDKMRNSEEERLRKVKTEMEESVKQELEAIRLDKESIEATMKQEWLILAEKAESEHMQMLHNFEQRKQELENDMQKRHEAMVKKVQGRESVFEEERLKKITDTNHLKEVAERQKEEIESEMLSLAKEKQEIELNKQQLEKDQFEIGKDIEALDILTKKLRNQREQLINEKTQFRSLIQKVKDCKTCGDSFQEFVSFELQLPNMEDMESFPLPGLASYNNSQVNVSPYSGVSNKRSPVSDGHMSWLRNCASKILNLTPNKRDQDVATFVENESYQSAAQFHADDEYRAPASKVEISVINEMGVLSNNFRDANADNTQSVDDGNTNHKVPGLPEESEKSDLKSDHHRRGRKHGVHGTKSVKAVVEDAQAFLGNNLRMQDMNEDQLPNNSANVSIDGREESSHAQKAPSSVQRKRPHSEASRMTESEHDVDDNEGPADSVTTGGRRKRRNTITPALSTPGERRYNLRRPRMTNAAPTEQTTTGKGKKKEKAAVDEGEGTSGAALRFEEAPSQSMDVVSESDKRPHLVWTSTTKSVEFSSDRNVRFQANTSILDDKVDAAKLHEYTLLSEEVNGESENVNEDENGSMFYDGEDGDDSDDDDDSDHPGQASVGRKLWSFFMS